MPLTFLIGGARSGKSSLAVRRVRTWVDSVNQGTGADAQTGATSVAFVATATAGDEEMIERIDFHQRERDLAWRTIEAPFDLVAGIRQALDTGPNTAVIVDCLSFWVANHVMQCDPNRDAWAMVEQQLSLGIDDAVTQLKTSSAPCILVTNDVGSGLIPDNPLGRQFRDTLGRINARASLAADDAFLVVAGRVLQLGKHP